MLVRFAPSPTGFLHIGNARTLLINYLFAKKNQGSFLFRMDDTDRERSKEVFEKSIFADLEWLGIRYDQFARQSERFSIYAAAVDYLKTRGLLYPCFETTEELEFKRKKQLSRKIPPVYDRESLRSTAEQKENYIQEGRLPYWRFKLNHTIVEWNDLTKGPLSFDMRSLSDPVLVKADGTFLYTLSSVVDDLDFNITHIIRGEDHVTNTAVQIQLFDALRPFFNKKESLDIVFAHTTHILAEDGGSLSKRLGSLGLKDLREQGLEAQTIIAYLARLGTSLPIEPIASLDSLVEQFSLSHFSKAPPRFSRDDLFSLNHKLLQLMSFEEVKDSLETLLDEDLKKSLSFDTLKALFEVCRNNLSVLSDFCSYAEILSPHFQITSSPSSGLLEADDLFVLKASLSCFPIELNHNTWKQWTTDISQATGFKGKKLFKPLRVALTGRDHGPEMRLLLPLLSLSVIRKRIESVPNE